MPIVATKNMIAAISVNGNESTAAIISVGLVIASPQIAIVPDVTIRVMREKNAIFNGRPSKLPFFISA